MESPDALACFAALGQPTRLAVLRLLVRAGPDGLPAGAIAAQTGTLPNTLSANLTVLARAGLVVSRRDRRNIRYAAALPTLRGLADFLLSDCCGGNPDLCRPLINTVIRQERPLMRDTPFNVLFLCTANSARSLIAESILNATGGGRFRAFSAGSHPAGQPNPHTLTLLGRRGYPLDGLRSKSWDAFSAPDAPEMDFVFTVCDNAAGEVCPVWPGQPISAHWGVPDPAAAKGSETEIAAAFAETHKALAARLAAFTALPIGTLDRKTLRARVADIGQTADAS